MSKIAEVAEESIWGGLFLFTGNLSSQQLLKAEEVSIVGSFKYKMHLVIQDYERGNS